MEETKIKMASSWFALTKEKTVSEESEGMEKMKSKTFHNVTLVLGKRNILWGNFQLSLIIVLV